MIRKENITTGTSIIALVISISTFFVTTCQNSKMNKFQQKNLINNNKPIIVVDSVSFEFFNPIDINKVISNIKNKAFIDYPDTSKEILISDTLIAKIRFRITNKGKDNARIVAYYLWDSTSGDDYLRKIICNKTYKTIEMGKDSGKENYYKHIHLQPQGSTFLTIKRSISTITEEGLTIHLLILYENDLENLYDTYYWARFNRPEFKFTIGLPDPTSTPPPLSDQNYLFIFSKDSNKNAIRMIDDNIAFKVYTEDEQKLLNNNLLKKEY